MIVSKVPEAVGVPEMTPVCGSMLSPGGRLLAPKLADAPGETSGTERLPDPPARLVLPHIERQHGVAVPPSLVIEIGTRKTPASLGTPPITPVVTFRLSPSAAT